MRISMSAKPTDYDEPPPSYEEAITELSLITSPQVPQRPSTQQPPRPPQRPPQAPPAQNANAYGPSSSSSHSSSSNSHSNASNAHPDNSLSLYTTNPNLPFRYPKGYFCQKCRNSGFKVKYSKYCSTCWSKFYLNSNAYNPNPHLPFRYPKRFYCEKCNNTGTKVKNGKTCKDCYERFAPRNVTTGYSGLSFFDPFDLFGTTTTTYVTPLGPMVPNGPNMGYPNAGPPNMGPNMWNHNSYGNFPPQQAAPIRVLPGDPRLGSTLCGRCRGSGRVHFLLDEELCPVCNGIGRILNRR